MWILPTFMLLLGAQRGWATETCDKDKGPPGTIECLKFIGFEGQYQLGTCLTSEHILHNSNHTRICSDRTQTYCWFTCMGELYGVSSGSVPYDCSCDPYGGTSTPSISLPYECYHPPGDNCYWYRTCWEKKYPCKPSDNGYVIRYAEKFCRVVEEHKAKLSPNAQKWMEAVRRCLQVNSVSLLDLGATCNDIREKVLDAYTSCYLNPGSGVSINICDLNCWQHSKIFWSIKASFPKLDTAWESFKGLWNIENRCSPSNNEESAKCFERNLKSVIKFVKLNVKNLLKRKRRSSDLNSKAHGDVLSQFADGVGSAIANSLNWKTDVMDWIAYTAHWVDLGILDIVIMLADKKALGIVTGPIPSVDLDHIIQDLASAVRKGTLRPQVQGYNVWIRSLYSCSDKSCETIRMLANSHKPPNGATRSSYGALCLCEVTALWIMLMNMYF